MSKVNKGRMIKAIIGLGVMWIFILFGLIANIATLYFNNIPTILAGIAVWVAITWLVIREVKRG